MERPTTSSVAACSMTAESADDYRDMMIQARARNLTMVCANPDIIVERGERLIYCAGAIADLYRAKGGDVIFYGKPYRPIYDQAMSLAGGGAGRTDAGPRPGDRRSGSHRPQRRARPASTACSSPPASMPTTSKASNRWARRGSERTGSAPHHWKALMRELKW